MAALTAFYNINFEPHVGSQFYESNAIHCSFGDTNAHLFGSPGLCWSGIDAYPSLLNDQGEVVYPPEEDLLLGAVFLNGQQQQQQQQQQPTLVDSSMQQSYSFDHQELAKKIQYLEHREEFFASDSPQMCASDESGLTTQVDVVTVAEESEYVSELEIKHEPPPLNNKRLEKIEDPDESIEAAEVSVDLIQNRRPFQCGLAGCNKTFKNPQTMKMHHKTHYTDGSAGNVNALPTLTNSATSNNNNNTSKGQAGNKKIPSRCPKCRKTFVGLYELRRHYGRKHSEGEKPHGCRKCGKRFYIEVDVRDHEKLCGEPIQCKCGLKFAFKCNLVAHKKAHPACHGQEQNIQQQQQQRQRQRRRGVEPQTVPARSACFVGGTTTCTTASNNESSSKSTTTSDGESARSSKRHRRESESDSITSRYLAASSAPAPDFNWLPGNVWDSNHNMHYPSVVDFANLPSYSESSLLFQEPQIIAGSFKQEASSVDLLHLHPKFNALHNAMARLN